MEVVSAWVAHCDRVGLTKHPVIWSRHWDIWNRARGEIGIPFRTTSVRVAAYAGLVPFMVCPEIRQSEIIYDDAGPGWLNLVTISILKGDITTKPRRIEYSITDNGRYRFSEPVVKAPPEEVWSSVVAALQTRSNNLLDGDEFTFDEAVEMAGSMVVEYE